MVNYQDLLHIIWIPGALGDDERLRFETSSQYVLEAVAAIEEHNPDRLAEEQPELHQELSRIDAKLQLILELVAQLRKAPDDAESQPRRNVIFSADRVEFEVSGEKTPPHGEGLLKVFLHPAIPEPLVLPGQIEEVSSRDEMSFATLTPCERHWRFREALSRHVFRHHRRQVAAARAGERQRRSGA